MDAIIYLKQRERMFGKGNNRDVNLAFDIESYERECPEIAVDAVEMWAMKNPLITNAKKFEEVFGFDPSPGILQTHNTRDAAWWDAEYIEPSKKDAQ